MTLEDIYNQLSYGELRMLFMGGKDIDSPNTQGMPIASFMQMLGSIQLGLTELHKRFALREGYFNLIIMPNVKTYSLTSDFAMSGSSVNPVKYIDDTEMPFTNNLHKVIRAYGILNGQTIELPLNEISNLAALRTPSYNQLTVPVDPKTATWLTETQVIDVVYRANHPEINKYIANEAPLITPIYLPDSHLEALLYYVASRVFNPIGMIPDAVHDGNNYMQKFEQSCARLKIDNYEIDQDAENNKLPYRGFC